MAKGLCRYGWIKDFEIRKIILDYLKEFNVVINFLTSWKGRKKRRSEWCHVKSAWSSAAGFDNGERGPLAKECEGL